MLEKKQEKGWRIRAESSGHVILLNKPPVTALWRRFSCCRDGA
ncbi:hypothetical protein ACNKHS_19075 [Shigella flexneri]